MEKDLESYMEYAKIFVFRNISDKYPNFFTCDCSKSELGTYTLLGNKNFGKFDCIKCNKFDIIDVNKKISERDNKSLKDLMREPFENHETEIIPDYFSKTYFHPIYNRKAG